MRAPAAPAAAIAASSASEHPVVPMMWTSPRAAAALASVTLTAGVVKSMMASASARAESTSRSHRDAQRLESGNRAGIGADGGGTRPGQRTGQRHPLMRGDGPDIGLTHAATWSGHNDPQLGHGTVLLVRPAYSSATAQRQLRCRFASVCVTIRAVWHHSAMSPRHAFFTGLAWRSTQRDRTADDTYQCAGWPAGRQPRGLPGLLRSISSAAPPMPGP